VVAVFAVICAFTAIWSIVKYQTIYRATIDLVPPQFQDSLSSRYAFPEYVLNPSTPLDLQAGYVQALAGASVAMLCFSLVWFSIQQTIGGWLALVFFFAVVVSTIKSWKTYSKNFDRLMAEDGRSETRPTGRCSNDREEP
jgi:hypothetical protein